jgi:hypothetical protein
MSSTQTVSPMQPPQDELKNIYLAGLRKRFKAEINRLTRADMQTLLRQRSDAELLSFLMTYVYAWHWLQHNVDSEHRTLLLDAFSKGPQGFLMQLLKQAERAEDFVAAYINHWRNYRGEPQLQQHNCLQLLDQQGNDAGQLQQYVMACWQALGLFEQSYTIAYRDLAQQEKERYREMLGPEDKQRLQLVDTLPDPVNLPGNFAKLGLIPHMGCPQTCRHCMFIFRPLLKDKQDPAELFQQVGAMTDSVLFTGGDLTSHLQHFYDAIGAMRQVRTFAILLNGDFADSPDVTRGVLDNMAQAIRRRPVHWPRARVILQISFDEFHQEVYRDKKGYLRERIPVYKIANIVAAAPRYGDEIQLCLVHKQHALNFSMALFSKGVFARLAAELGRRGHQVQILSATPSARLKRNPQNPDQPGQVVRDASFVLADYPNVPMLLTSSTMDGYGRASKMDVGETVNEKELLQHLLETGDAQGEYFDIDLMFWFNGWATLFSAVHMCLGNVFEEGMEKVVRRQRKDPLCAAMQGFDTRILALYAEIRCDLQEKIAMATGPHHLFHTLTEDAEVRLHMTRRLIELG